MISASRLLLGLAVTATVGTAANAASLQRYTRSAALSLQLPTVATATKAFPTLSGMKDLGLVTGSQPLHVVVSLPMRNKAMINSILLRQLTPGDSLYGHFLSTSETRSLFSPSGAQVNAVATYLQSQGFKNIYAEPDNQLVEADGTAAIASQAFATQIHNFSGSLGNIYANTKPALVPASLSGSVLAVLGLNNMAMHTNIRYAPKDAARAAARAAVLRGKTPFTSVQPVPRVSVTPVPCNGVSAPGGVCIANEYNAQQFRTAYDVAPNPNGNNNWGNTGKNTSIAIFTEGDMTPVLSDLKVYEKVNNLLPITPKIIHAGIPSPDLSGADEWDLDTQSSTGISQVVKNLYLYNITSLTDSDTTVGFARFQTDNIAKAGSASFAGCEIFPSLDGSLTTGDEIFARAAVQGQTVFNSSGDNGSSCPVAASTGVPGTGLPFQSYPDVSPYVVSVGGTSLVASTVPGAPPVYQLAWDGSGGGISVEDGAPFWQQGVVNPACIAPAAVPGVVTMKCVPDISMDADNNISPALIYVNGVATGVGGTSLASPLALGSWAMIETQRGNALGFAAPIIYQMYKKYTSYNSTTGMYTAPTVVPPNNQLIGGLIDITAGSNGGFQAIPGYDNVTGVGSFDVQKTTKLIPADYPHGP